MIPRKLTIGTKSSFFLFGARGTGKTRLLEQQFEQQSPLVIDLLLPRTFQTLSADPESLTALIQPAIRDKRLIIIDEIQKVPSLLDLVHYHIEKSNARFGLTGSSARKLKRGGANLLAGRAVTYNLFPFLESELGDSFELQRALSYGLLPRAAVETSIDEAILYLESYVDTYLSQEIIAEQVVRNLPPFQRFLTAAAQCNGSVINYSKLARDCQTDPSNVKSYFQILEDTLLGFFLLPYHQSIRKRQREAPKFYFIDTGIVRCLTNQIRRPSEPSTYEWGRLFEAFVISQLRANLDYQRSRSQLSYVLTKDGAEIDLIIEKSGKPTVCLEIKSGSIIHPGELSNLISLARGIPHSVPLCLYNGEAEQIHHGVRVLPYRQGIKEICDY